jgi:hypothetical protein
MRGELSSLPTLCMKKYSHTETSLSSPYESPSSPVELTGNSQLNYLIAFPGQCLTTLCKSASNISSCGQEGDMGMTGWKELSSPFLLLYIRSLTAHHENINKRTEVIPARKHWARSFGTTYATCVPPSISIKAIQNYQIVN